MAEVQSDAAQRLHQLPYAGFSYAALTLSPNDYFWYVKAYDAVTTSLASSALTPSDFTISDAGTQGSSNWQWRRRRRRRRRRRSTASLIVKSDGVSALEARRLSPLSYTSTYQK